MSAAEIVGACIFILGGMAGLIKAMVLSRLDKIDGKLDKQQDQLADHNGRIIRIEEWRANIPSALGRRATDHCPAADCPFEHTSPGVDR